MRRKACVTCGAEDGPAIFADRDTCCDFCEKVKKGEMSAERFEALTGRRVRNDREAH